MGHDDVQKPKPDPEPVHLALQLMGLGPDGALYVLDEPSVGLHSTDTARLISLLERLRDRGNTVLVVEHDEEAIRAADQVVDIGPGAGVQRRIR